MTRKKREFETRLFEEKHLSEVVHINQTCLPENYTSSFFLNIYRNYPLTFLIATLNEKAVGYIMCRVEIGLSKIKGFKIIKKGHIISIAVLPEQRRKGIAQALLSETLTNISKSGINECYLEVRVSNKPAIELYKNFGFMIQRVSHGYYRDGEDSYVMAKSLS